MKILLQYISLILLMGLSSIIGGAVAKERVDDAGPKLEMDTIGPRELEEDIKPYHRCLWQWARAGKGRYHTLRHEMNFENGPAACVQEGKAFIEKGNADLAVKISDQAERRRRVHLQLVGENIEIFGAIVWMSQFEVEGQQ